MKALVAVGLGYRDVVLEPVLYGFPHAVDYAEHGIAFVYAPAEYPDAEDVEKAAGLNIIFKHLLVDGVDVLDPRLGLYLDSLFLGRILYQLLLPLQISGYL